MPNVVNITVSLEKELSIPVSTIQDVTIREIEVLLKYFIQLPADLRSHCIGMVCGSFGASHPGDETIEQIAADIRSI